MTVNSQPRVCGRPSTDPDFGFESLRVGPQSELVSEFALGREPVLPETNPGIRTVNARAIVVHDRVDFLWCRQLSKTRDVPMSSVGGASPVVASTRRPT